MKRITIAFYILLVTPRNFAVGQDVSDLRLLYDAHRWFELRDAVHATHAPIFFRGVIECAFNQLEACARDLQPVIQSAPQSDQALGAREVLTYAYQRAGHYRQALAQIQEMLAAAPEAADVKNAQAFFAALSRHPDQSVVAGPPSKLRYRIEDGNIFIPVTINGKVAKYMIDTGANFSSISETAAKRLGMVIDEVKAKGQDSTGGEVRFRTAVASRLAIGKVQLRDVAFLVIGDDQQPFVDLPVDMRGILGLPVILALETMRWSKDGTMEVAFDPERKAIPTPNLSFDGGDAISQAEFQQQKISLLVDTGAEHTYLWPPFARDFASVVNPFKKNESTRVTGVGQSAEIESITAPELTLRIGDLDTVLRPAHVLLKQTTSASRWYHGSIGLDLLNQAHTVTFDFKSMTLALKSK